MLAMPPWPRTSHRPRGLLAVVLVSGFALLTPPTPANPDPDGQTGTASPRPDVVLITIDTLRADALGFAGNETVATPNLDRLAAGGKVFPFAHAHNVVTLPSHANILTGLYPYQHGVRDNDGFRLDPSFPTLATRLHDAGWATAAFVAAYPLDASFGLDQGFEVYDDAFPRGGRRTAFVLPERRGDTVVAAALDWWNATVDRPRFLWLHLFDPHAPYSPPEPFASRYAKTPYLGEVAATDHFLGPLLEPLLNQRDSPGDRPALVVLTADHGEALGEHGELTHGLFAYEPTLAVPLVVWGPGIESGRDPRPARHIDVVPTVLDVVGLPATPAGEVPLPGSSLLTPVEDTAPVSTYFEAMSASLNRGWAPLYGRIEAGHKLIVLPIAELYDLGQDPAETTNRLRDDRARAIALRDGLPSRDVVWPRAGTAPTNPEAQEALRSLGYLGGTATVRERYGPEDDPKNLIELDRAMHKTIELYSLGQLDEAIALARSVVEERPTMSLGQSLLAQALLEKGQTVEAIAAIEAAARHDAASPVLMRQLGLALAQTGRHDEALALLKPLSRDGTDDTEDRNAYALALSEAGKQGEAAATLAQVLADTPDDPIAFEQLALVELRRERWEPARQAAQRAVDLDAGLHRAWNNLGVALDALGDTDGALDAWQQAVSLDPKLFDALYNLGTRAAQHGRVEVARQALERFVAEAPATVYGKDLPRARVLLARLRRQSTP